MVSLTILKDFLLQLALIAIIIFTHHIFFAGKSERNRYEKIVLIVLFGLSVLLCMSVPMIFAPDYRVDIRIVPLLLGTLYAGWEAGIVLSVMIIAYRSSIGIDLGLYTTVLTILFSMPLILYVQKFFAYAEKKKRLQIALVLLIFYSLIGMTTVCAVRGLSLINELRIHSIHIIFNVLAILFFVSLNEMIREMDRKNQNAEIAFLRSQIKPHFLYNTLNSIATLCVKEPSKAEQLTLEFAQYLRRSFDFKHLDSFTTLEDELELVKAYLYIEKSRFGAKLNAEYEVAANLDFRLPPLILQPLVENAVRHGLMSNLRGGTVKITIRQLDNEAIRFTVEDNGCGMSEAQLAEILQSNGSTNGVGLRNIFQRLKLIYGTSVHMKSAEGKGTTVDFQLPAIAAQTAWRRK